MPNPLALPTVVSRIMLKVDNKLIAAHDPVLGQILEVVVDQHVHLPGMFTLRFQDADLKLLDQGPFTLAKPIEIATQSSDQATITLIKGEITAVEPEFHPGMVAELVVRGYDRLHRLYRESKSKTYLNVKDSDLARQIARSAGLPVEVDETVTVYEHIYQHNQSDLGFLMQRAWRIGYECFVDGEGKLIFRKPQTTSSQLTLTWGDDLVSFFPRMTLAEQVEELVVKGWDPQNKTAIVGQAQRGRLYPQVQERNGREWSTTLGTPSKMAIVDQPVVSQAEANILAGARLDEISGLFIEAEGEAFRRPDLHAGQRVKLAGLGSRLSGEYLVTSATHTYSTAGFSTRFSVRGARMGLLSEQMGAQPPLSRWVGVVPAVVTNTDDPNTWGRVKVKFPWLSEEDESAWARVVSAGGGPKAGFCITPAVNDEVMVTFVHGDFNQPVVLGGVWNGQDALPEDVAAAADGEKPLVRTWTSTTGHQLSLYDNAEKKVELRTAQGHHLLLNDAEKKVEIVTSGQHKVTMDDQSKQLMLTTTSGLSITLNDSAGEITIQATGNLTLQAGATLALSASTLSLSAASLSMSGSGKIDLNTSGPVSIKGAIINLNQ